MSLSTKKFVEHSIGDVFTASDGTKVECVQSDGRCRCVDTNELCHFNGSASSPHCTTDEVACSPILRKVSNLTVCYIKVDKGLKT